MFQAERDKKVFAVAQAGEALAGAAATVGMLWDEHNKRTAPAKVAAMNLTKKEAEEELEKRLLQTVRWANGLGTVANAYSVGMSGYQTFVNLMEGDDAAIAHAVKTAGFGLSTLVTGARTIVAIKILKDTALGLRAAAFLAGPWGWVGLLLLVLGEILLAWVFKEDTPLEQWLYNGPFSRPQSPSQQIVYREDGSKWLIGPKQNALKLDAFDRILEVIDENPYGLFHTTPEGAVVTREGDDYRIIGFQGDPIDKRFLAEFNAPNRAQRFNGHTPGTDPEDQYGWWYEHPESAAKALADAIFSPKVTLYHRKATRINAIDILEIRIDLGAFLDGKSLLFAELWRTDSDGNLKDKPGENKVRLCTGEGSGPKSIRVEWPIVWTNKYIGIEHICVRVSLDLNGDGSLWLPMPPGDTGAIVHEEIPAKEEVACVVRRWVEKRDVLKMHGKKRTALAGKQAQASHQARRERIEARLKQEKGDSHD
jgi:hypothetical protein